MFRKIEAQIHKTVDYYRQKGFIQFLKHVFEKMGFEHFSRTLIFIALDTEEIPDDVKIPYSFHLATIDDIQDEPDHYFQHKYLFTKREIVERLKGGHRLFVFKENNRMVYFLWIEQEKASIEVFRLPLQIPHYMAYMSGEFTMPEYRRKGIALKLKKEIFYYLKNREIKKLIAVVHPSNSTALHSDKMIGFKEYQTVNYKRYWHIRRYTVQKYNSDEHKIFTTLFKSPKHIWKTYL